MKWSGAEMQVCVQTLPPNRSMPLAALAQVVLQKTVIYTVQSDTSSLHLPTIKQGLVVTDGPMPMASLLPGTLLSSAGPRS